MSTKHRPTSPDPLVTDALPELAVTDGRERSYDLVAEAYERTRPSYPPELLGALPLAGDAAVLDLGAGTGKLTRVLAARYRLVTAVEPLANMRAVLERVVPDDVTALAGSAERIPLEDGSVDAVFAAQAFHWFDKRVALPEIVRVLRPRGVFAVVWNESLPDALPRDFCAALDALHEAAPKPRGEETEWEELLERSGLFRWVHRRVSVPHLHVLDRAAMLDNLRSVSWIASRNDREDVVARLGELLPDGMYATPTLACVLWAERA